MTIEAHKSAIVLIELQSQSSILTASAEYRQASFCGFVFLRDIRSHNPQQGTGPWKRQPPVKRNTHRKPDGMCGRIKLCHCRQWV